MIDSTTQTQEVRTAVDRLLQIVKDNIRTPVLETYKSKNNVLLYLPMIRALLEEVNPNYDASLLIDDQSLLEKLDLNQWLTLILERWDYFEKSLTKMDMGYVKNLKAIRNKWAHHNNISLQEAHTSANAACELLKSFGCNEPAAVVAVIHNQLELQIRRVIPESQPDWSMNTESNPASNNESEPVDEEATLPFTAFDDRDLHLEIVPRNGDAIADKIPLNNDRIVIGRSQSHADIKVKDQRVSRVHLLITKTSPTELKVTDLMSANGTKLDKTKLDPNDPQPWKVGQMVTVGDTWLILRQGAA